MAGRWSGFGTSIVLTNTIIPCLDVDPTAAKCRRFHADVEIIPCLMPAELTLSASDTLDGIGKNPDGHRIEIHGKVREMDGYRIMALRYKHWEPGSKMDMGYLALIQMNSGAAWNRTNGAYATGFWDGSYTPDAQRAGGRMSEELVNLFDSNTKQLTTAIQGTVSFFDVFLEDPPAPIQPGLHDLIFPVKGTVNPPEPGVDPLIPLIGVTDSQNPKHAEGNRSPDRRQRNPRERHAARHDQRRIQTLLQLLRPLHRSSRRQRIQLRQGHVLGHPAACVKSLG